MYNLAQIKLFQQVELRKFWKICHFFENLIFYLTHNGCLASCLTFGQILYVRGKQPGCFYKKVYAHYFYKKPIENIARRQLLFFFLSGEAL